MNDKLSKLKELTERFNNNIKAMLTMKLTSELTSLISFLSFLTGNGLTDDEIKIVEG